MFFWLLKTHAIMISENILYFDFEYVKLFFFLNRVYVCVCVCIKYTQWPRDICKLICGTTNFMVFFFFGAGDWT
jgi:hypothetical protein